MSWKSLVDKALGTDFDKPQYDPKKGRDKLIHQINLAAKQHTEGSTRAPNRSWKAGGSESNPAIRFEAKVDGKSVLLDGDKAVFVPASRFQDFLKHLKTSVEAGELDKDIKTALESGKSSDTEAKAPRASSGGRDPISNVRSSIGRSMSNGKSLEEAEAIVRGKGKYDAALIDQVVAEVRAK